jgi:hypothetical protein
VDQREKEEKVYKNDRITWERMENWRSKLIEAAL